MDEASLEFATALRAMKMASVFCQNVGRDLAKQGSLLKSDRSPVTIADYGSQAIVCRLLREKFPGDVIVAEEDATELRNPGREKILGQVTQYVQGLLPDSIPERICSWIDYSSQTTTDRFWTLDPIDGTKGFLRGDQYAIALALIESGVVTLGMMACPNLYQDRTRPHEKYGCLFAALRRKGSFQMDLEGRTRKALSVSRVTRSSEASFAESVEPDHADQLFHRRVAEKLGIGRPPLRMDSQAKYGIVARGEAAIYLRVPSPSEPGYRENIWDHAAGSVIVEEAGGRVTDVLGHSLDFSSGVRMEGNRGILATNGILHDVILQALEIQ